MDRVTRRAVWTRAQGRCEYCRIAAEHFPRGSFHVEHIRPRVHGGTESLGNLALACYHCNAHKGPNLTGIDPLSDQFTPLFHPRTDAWSEHFARAGHLIVGLTAIGRATVGLLNMNSPSRVALRMELGDQ